MQQVAHASMPTKPWHPWTTRTTHKLAGVLAKFLHAIFACVVMQSPLDAEADTGPRFIGHCGRRDPCRIRSFTPPGNRIRQGIEGRLHHDTRKYGMKELCKHTCEFV